MYSELFAPRGVIIGGGMPTHHPSRTYRGCALCSPRKRRGIGVAARETIPTLRKLGKSRRLNRRDLGDHADDLWERNER
jgi:hypothetical protein